MAKKKKVEPSVSFDEIWEVMDDAVKNVTFDKVPGNWREMPELSVDYDDDDPDDKETAKQTPQAIVKAKCKKPKGK